MVIVRRSRWARRVTGRGRRFGALVLLLSIVSVSDAGASSTTTTATTTGLTTATFGPPQACGDAGVAGRCFTWHYRDPWSPGRSVATTTFRPFASEPATIAYASWLRTSSTDLALYPGYEGPGVTSLSRGPEMVPTSARGRLLATFNSGFYEKDAAGGFFVNHTLYFPMVHGLATVVRYRDGSVDVVAWAGGARPGTNVVMARQNVGLLVSGGAPTPASANNSLWGLTLHGVAAVWRTALGVDPHGNLVYLAASAVTSSTLAAIMVQLHLVRAMELDINPEWPIFVTYGAPGAVGATLDVPNPNQIPGRFLYPSTKDFFALYATTKPGEPQPW